MKQVYQEELGISLPSAWIMCRLMRCDGVTQNDLASAARVDASMITRLVKEMESEHGWIRRERDPEDNRLVRVYLTERGRERARGLAGRIAELDGRITRRLDDDQLQRLREMLRTLEATAAEDYESRVSRAAPEEETG